MLALGLLAAAASLAAAVSAPGTGTPQWAQFGADHMHTRVSPFSGTQTGTPSWKVSSGVRLGYASPAIGADGTVYVSGIAINGTTGMVLWKGVQIMDTPAIDASGTLYGGTAAGAIIATSAAGKQLWSYQTGGQIFSSPTVKGGRVYVGSWDHSLYCLDAATGALVWKFTTQLMVASSPAIGDGDFIVFGSSDNNVYAVNAAGQQVWVFSTDAAVESSPTLGSNGLVYVGNDHGNFHALNVATGALVWSWSCPYAQVSSPALGPGGLVIVGANSNNVTALNGSTGEVVWEFTTGSFVQGSPSDLDDKGHLVPNYDAETATFEEMHLKQELMSGFEAPSAIQQKTIVPIQTGRDVFAEAQLGTGKTAAFTISIFQKIDWDLKACQALVLVATREGALQVKTAMDGLCKHTPVSVHAALGGTAVRLDLEALRRGAQVVIGTPGRLLDLNHRGAIDFSNLKLIVVDGADTVTQRGFKDTLIDIRDAAPSSAQVAMFTTAVAPEVLELGGKLLHDPVVVFIKRRDTSVDGMKQFWTGVEGDSDEDRVAAMAKIMKELSVSQAVVFVNKRKQAEWVTAAAKEAGLPAIALHGDMDTRDRLAAFAAFRDPDIRLLVTSDVLARGIDVPQVNTVINFDMPGSVEMYGHRIGRQGGAAGVAITLVGAGEEGMISAIEEYYHVGVKALEENMEEAIAAVTGDAEEEVEEEDDGKE